MAENKNETKNPETTATNPTPAPEAPKQAPQTEQPEPKAPEAPKSEPAPESIQIVRHIHEPKTSQPWDEFAIETAQLAIKTAVIAAVATGVAIGVAALCGQTESK